MKFQIFSIRLGTLALFLVSLASHSVAQNDENQWLRVITEEESVIDVKRNSLVLENDQIVRANFRTTFITIEPVLEKPEIKYQVREDTIQFDFKTGKYRFYESTFRDGNGKAVLSLSRTSQVDWKSSKGRTLGKLVGAIDQLAPFGYWKLLSYHYADGSLPGDDEPRALTELLGREIGFNHRLVQLAEFYCSRPVIETKAIKNEEFIRQIGTPLSSLGISSDKVDSILIKCVGQTRFPEKTLILRLSDTKALMLWDGVFFEFERGPNLFRP